MKNKLFLMLCENLQRSVKKDCGKPVSIAFSGGIDSSLIALLARKNNDVELLTVGTPNSHDLEAAETAAKIINIKLKRIEVMPELMVLEGRKMQKHLDLKPIEIEFMLPFWIAAKEAKYSTLMCGQGADELFGGYARFKEKKQEINLAKEVDDLKKRIPEREKMITDFFNLKLSCPYLSEKVIESANKFSENERIGDLGKEVLREAAIMLGLPREIAERKKKAAQYGSGSQKAIKKIVKHRIQFEIKFDSSEIAKSVAKATEPENLGWVETEVIGNKITAIVKAENLGSLREATEDFMSCLSVAEEIAKQ